MAKLLDIFACKECDRAIFLNLEDRATDHFVCPHCQHDQSREEAMQSYEAELAAQKDEAPASIEDPPNYPDVLACGSCDQAIKLSAEEQSNDSLNCPSCAAALPPAIPAPKKVESKPKESTSAKPDGLAKQKTKAKAADASDPEPAQELPELMSCDGCERAIFVSKEDRTAGTVQCDHCGHQHGSDALKQIAGEQASRAEGEGVTEPVVEPAFPELLECPDCQRAIKLLPDQRDASSTNCPYCETTIKPPEPEPIIEKEKAAVEPLLVEPEESAVTETETESVESVLFEDDVPQMSDETPQVDGLAGDESVSLFEDEGGPSDDSEEVAPLISDEADSGDMALFDDGEPEGGQPEDGQEADEADTSLLESIIETSRNQSLMPECFNCPKCETEIALPEVERMMGLCFCPECEELIDSNTAQANVPEKPEADDDEGADGEQPEPVVGEGEHAHVEESEKKTDGQDVGAAMDVAASEMEFWLDEVLPEVVDCVKCGDSLKLDDEEKMFGIYGCPYCKVHINHSKGEEVLSILGGIEDGEDKKETPKLKPIKVNFKALRPYAALLVFSAGLIYGVIKTADYIYERTLLKKQFSETIRLKTREMKGRREIYGKLLEDEEIKSTLGQLESLSISELKGFRKTIDSESELVYAEWFEEEGKKIETINGSRELVVDFRSKIEKLNADLKLAHMDTENLSNAIGLSDFERRQGTRLIKEHVKKMSNSLTEISNDRAIKNGLVAPRVVENLISLKAKIEDFKIHSARDAVREFMEISKESYELSVYFPVDGGRGYEAIRKIISDEITLKFVSTPWNPEIRNWRESKKDRKMDAWKKTTEGFDELRDSLKDFHEKLGEYINPTVDLALVERGLCESREKAKRAIMAGQVFVNGQKAAKASDTVKPIDELTVAGSEKHASLGGHKLEYAKKDFRRFNHKFLDGAFRVSLNNFNNLDGVRELKLVNKLMQTRLEELANKLDPNVSDSLSRRIRLRQASATKMTELEVKKFYDNFDELWKPFLDDREWFSRGELSSYYRLANPTKDAPRVVLKLERD